MTENPINSYVAQIASMPEEDALVLRDILLDLYPVPAPTAPSYTAAQIAAQVLGDPDPATEVPLNTPVWIVGNTVTDEWDEPHPFPFGTPVLVVEDDYEVDGTYLVMEPKSGWQEWIYSVDLDIEDPYADHRGFPTRWLTGIDPYASTGSLDLTGEGNE